MSGELTERITIRVSKQEKQMILEAFGPSKCVSRNVMAYLLNPHLRSSPSRHRALMALLSGIYSMIESHLLEQRPTDLPSFLEFLEVILTCRKLIDSIEYHASQNPL